MPVIKTPLDKVSWTHDFNSDIKQIRSDCWTHATYQNLDYKIKLHKKKEEKRNLNVSEQNPAYLGTRQKYSIF